MVFSENMKTLREYENQINVSDLDSLNKNKEDVKALVQMIVEKKRENNDSK